MHRESKAAVVKVLKGWRANILFQDKFQISKDVMRLYQKHTSGLNAKALALQQTSKKLAEHVYNMKDIHTEEEDDHSITLTTEVLLLTPKELLDMTEFLIKNLSDKQISDIRNPK